MTMSPPKILKKIESLTTELSDLLEQLPNLVSEKIRHSMFDINFEVLRDMVTIINEIRTLSPEDYRAVAKAIDDNVPDHSDICTLAETLRAPNGEYIQPYTVVFSKDDLQKIGSHWDMNSKEGDTLAYARISQGSRLDESDIGPYENCHYTPEARKSCASCKSKLWFIANVKWPRELDGCDTRVCFGSPGSPCGNVWHETISAEDWGSN